MVLTEVPSNRDAIMVSEAFSEEWSRQWCQLLNNRPSYQEAAASWEGGVGLLMTRDGSPTSELRAVFLDLWHGSCRGARVATPEDLESAQYILTGTSQAWRGILTGKVAPLTAVMTGKIRLTRGSLGALVPFAAAARELVATAMGMEVSFPDGW
jgi:putative sterol carrier protein